MRKSMILIKSMRLMKTTWEIRKEKQIEAPKKKDSEYKPVVREFKRFNELKIPKTLEKNLPFESKDKIRQMSRKERF